MAVFRMSAHKLHVETGRHNRTPRGARVCRFCEGGHVEDELHVFTCPKYEHIRHAYGIPVATQDDDQYVRRIMNCGWDSAAWKKFASFLLAVFDTRAA